MINVTGHGLEKFNKFHNPFLNESNTENLIGTNQSELNQVTTVIPRSNLSRFPPRLLQLLISLRRECHDKLNNQPDLDTGKI